MSRKSEAHTFKAKVYKLGINPCVDVPARISRAFARRGSVPVKGMLQDAEIRATLVPKGGGLHRLYLNGDMRKRAGVDTGDMVTVTLSLDTESREIPIPEDLKRAFQETKGAREAFEALTASRRKELLVWVLDAKKEETRKQRIQRVIQYILKHPVVSHQPSAFASVADS